MSRFQGALVQMRTELLSFEPSSLQFTVILGKDGRLLVGGLHGTCEYRAQ